MSKPFRDSSSGGGLDVVVTLPAPVCEKIKQAAKERDKTFEGWHRATIIEAVSVVWQHETIERWLEAEASMPILPTRRCTAARLSRTRIGEAERNTSSSRGTLTSWAG